MSDTAPHGWTYMGPDGQWYWSLTQDPHESVTEQRPATPAEYDLGFQTRNAREDAKKLQDLLDIERYKVAIGVNLILKAVQSRMWLSEPGRGSFVWDDETYQAEFGAAIDEITTALKPLQTIARDWSHCPTDPLRVAANRAAAIAMMKEFEG